jgi:hypothetical protein
MTDLLTSPFIETLRKGSDMATNPLRTLLGLPAEKTWGVLAPPVFPDETRLIARAQSILTGGDLGVCPPLPAHQARDVIAWHQPNY